MIKITEIWNRLISTFYFDKINWFYLNATFDPVGIKFTVLVWVTDSKNQLSKVGLSKVIDESEVKKIINHPVILTEQLNNIAIELSKSIELFLEQNPGYTIDHKHTKQFHYLATMQRTKV